MLATAGVRPGVLVAGLMGRRPESFATALGVWYLGAVYVPLFSGFGGAGLRSRLSDSGPVAIVTDTASRPFAGRGRGGRSGHDRRCRGRARRAR